jgi:hypothetical protein
MAAPTIPEYHEALRQLMEHEQPALWRWFVQSVRTSEHDAAEAELELLKSAYRLDGDGHAALAGIAQVLAGKLGLAGDVVLYQALDDTGRGRNAGVTMLGDVAHVVFAGDLLSLLDLHEQEAVLAHELAHVWLFQHDEGAFRVLDHLVHRLAAESDAPTVAETARRLRLHTEVFADRMAVELVAAPSRARHESDASDTSTDPDTLATVVRALVKLHSGLHHVDAAAYLRQAREILEADSSASLAWTHPELHVRIACLAARDTDGIGNIEHHLIDGRDDLDRLDLLGQRRLEQLTARVLAGVLPVAHALPGAPRETIDLHVTLFDADFRAADSSDASPLDDDELADAAPSVCHFAAALVLDFAMLMRSNDADLADLARLTKEAHRIGVGKEFDTLLTRVTANGANGATATAASGSPGSTR